MHISNTIKVTAGNVDRNTPLSTKVFESASARFDRTLEQEISIDQNLAGLVYEVANQVAIEHGRYLQRFFVKPE